MPKQPALSELSVRGRLFFKNNVKTLFSHLSPANAAVDIICVISDGIVRASAEGNFSQNRVVGKLAHTFNL